MRKKSFDCVEMKRKGARRVYEATKNMTIEEEVEYWRRRTEEARRWLEEGVNVKSVSTVAAR
jgi:hypothetical protein